MSKLSNYNRGGNRHVYKGTPNKQSEKEKSKFKKFLSRFAIPFIKKLWELGMTYIEARAEKEKAQAASHNADAELKLAQARKVDIEAKKEMLQITERAAAIEIRKLDSLEVKAKLTDKELEEEVAKLSNFIHLLYLKYGLELRMDVDQPPSDSGGIGELSEKMAVPYERTEESQLVLSARELEIYNLYYKGYDSLDIASELNITHGSVKAHIHKIREKMKREGIDSANQFGLNRFEENNSIKPPILPETTDPFDSVDWDEPIPPAE